MTDGLLIVVGAVAFVAGAWLIATERVAQRRKAARRRALLIRLYLECAR